MMSVCTGAVDANDCPPINNTSTIQISAFIGSSPYDCILDRTLYCAETSGLNIVGVTDSGNETTTLECCEAKLTEDIATSGKDFNGACVMSSVLFLYTEAEMLLHYCNQTDWYDKTIFEYSHFCNDDCQNDLVEPVPVVTQEQADLCPDPNCIADDLPLKPVCLKETGANEYGYVSDWTNAVMCDEIKNLGTYESFDATCLVNDECSNDYCVDYLPCINANSDDDKCLVKTITNTNTNTNTNVFEFLTGPEQTEDICRKIHIDKLLSACNDSTCEATIAACCSAFCLEFYKESVNHTICYESDFSYVTTKEDYCTLYCSDPDNAQEPTDYCDTINSIACETDCDIKKCKSENQTKVYCVSDYTQLKDRDNYCENQEDGYIECVNCQVNNDCCVLKYQTLMSINFGLDYNLCINDLTNGNDFLLETNLQNYCDNNFTKDIASTTSILKCHDSQDNPFNCTTTAESTRECNIMNCIEGYEGGCLTTDYLWMEKDFQQDGVDNQEIFCKDIFFTPVNECLDTNIRCNKSQCATNFCTYHKDTICSKANDYNPEQNVCETDYGTDELVFCDGDCAETDCELLKCNATLTGKTNICVIDVVGSDYFYATETDFCDAKITATEYDYTLDENTAYCVDTSCTDENDCCKQRCGGDDSIIFKGCLLEDSLDGYPKYHTFFDQTTLCIAYCNLGAQPDMEVICNGAANLQECQALCLNFECRDVNSAVVLPMCFSNDDENGYDYFTTHSSYCDVVIEGGKVENFLVDSHLCDDSSCTNNTFSDCCSKAVEPLVDFCQIPAQETHYAVLDDKSIYCATTQQDWNGTFSRQECGEAGCDSCNELNCFIDLTTAAQDDLICPNYDSMAADSFDVTLYDGKDTFCVSEDNALAAGDCTDHIGDTISCNNGDLNVNKIACCMTHCLKITEVAARAVDDKFCDDNTFAETTGAFEYCDIFCTQWNNNIEVTNLFLLEEVNPDTNVTENRYADTYSNDDRSNFCLYKNCVNAQNSTAICALIEGTYVYQTTTEDICTSTHLLDVDIENPVDTNCAVYNCALALDNIGGGHCDLTYVYYGENSLGFCVANDAVVTTANCENVLETGSTCSTELQCCQAKADSETFTYRCIIINNIFQEYNNHEDYCTDLLGAEANNIIHEVQMCEGPFCNKVQCCKLNPDNTNKAVCQASDFSLKDKDFYCDNIDSSENYLLCDETQDSFACDADGCLIEKCRDEFADLTVTQVCHISKIPETTGEFYVPVFDYCTYKVTNDQDYLLDGDNNLIDEIICKDQSTNEAHQTCVEAVCNCMVGNDGKEFVCTKKTNNSDHNDVVIEYYASLLSYCEAEVANSTYTYSDELCGENDDMCTDKQCAEQNCLLGDIDNYCDIVIDDPNSFTFITQAVYCERTEINDETIVYKIDDRVIEETECDCLQGKINSSVVASCDAGDVSRDYYYQCENPPQNQYSCPGEQNGDCSQLDCNNIYCNEQVLVVIEEEKQLCNSSNTVYADIETFCTAETDAVDKEVAINAIAEYDAGTDKFAAGCRIAMCEENLEESPDETCEDGALYVAIDTDTKYCTAIDDAKTFLQCDSVNCTKTQCDTQRCKDYTPIGEYCKTPTADNNYIIEEASNATVCDLSNGGNDMENLDDYTKCAVASCTETECQVLACETHFADRITNGTGLTLLYGTDDQTYDTAQAFCQNNTEEHECCQECNSDTSCAKQFCLFYFVDRCLRVDGNVVIFDDDVGGDDTFCSKVPIPAPMQCTDGDNVTNDCILSECKREKCEDEEVVQCRLDFSFDDNVETFCTAKHIDDETMRDCYEQNQITTRNCDAEKCLVEDCISNNTAYNRITVCLGTAIESTLFFEDLFSYCEASDDKKLFGSEEEIIDCEGICKDKCDCAQPSQACTDCENACVECTEATCIEQHCLAKVEIVACEGENVPTVDYTNSAVKAFMCHQKSVVEYNDEIVHCLENYGNGGDEIPHHCFQDTCDIVHCEKVNDEHSGFICLHEDGFFNDVNGFCTYRSGQESIDFSLDDHDSCTDNIGKVCADQVDCDISKCVENDEYFKSCANNLELTKLEYCTKKVNNEVYTKCDDDVWKNCETCVEPALTCMKNLDADQNYTNGYMCLKDDIKTVETYYYSTLLAYCEKIVEQNDDKDHYFDNNVDCVECDETSCRKAACMDNEYTPSCRAVDFIFLNQNDFCDAWKNNLLYVDSVIYCGENTCNDNFCCQEALKDGFNEVDPLCGKDGVMYSLSEICVTENVLQPLKCNDSPTCSDQTCCEAKCKLDHEEKDFPRCSSDSLANASVESYCTKYCEDHLLEEPVGITLENDCGEGCDDTQCCKDICVLNDGISVVLTYYDKTLYAFKNECSKDCVYSDTETLTHEAAGGYSDEGAFKTYYLDNCLMCEGWVDSEEEQDNFCGTEEGFWNPKEYCVNFLCREVRDQNFTSIDNCYNPTCAHCANNENDCIDPQCGNDGLDPLCVAKNCEQNFKCVKSDCDKFQCIKACEFVDAPVCATDKVVYDNTCIVDENCYDVSIEEGFFQDDYKVHHTCEEKDEDRSTCESECPYHVCMTGCSVSKEDVCGIDGKVYENECIPYCREVEENFDCPKDCHGDVRLTRCEFKCDYDFETIPDLA